METKQNYFTQRVIKLILSVPKGKVATYGLIAKLAGNPRGSRAVGWILHSSTHKYNLPWQRIIKSDGRLSFVAGSTKFLSQCKKLDAEGVLVINGRVDLKKYLWNKSRSI
ncbi:MGMT family protein [Candidatus Berkiella cookevillensis]|nr:MGMT family protein [Candidatus Berkiella cookevillensis]MCS5707922.1 MGMT family protein [Candidatus Berkiella cookevillensis]